MGGKHSRNKGHAFERQVAKDAGKALGFNDGEVRRTLQSRGGASDGSDVSIAGHFAIECKRFKEVTGLVVRALRQAERDAKPGQIPISICKGDREDAIVSMRYDDFWDMVQENRERGE